ncbi:MAG TPA: VOC family protein [Acidimicrobiales bacterium]|jgi:catechol 2,3-dioxygenase-like lactoylglutathione lyase family enzyme|nr:VOC family protein [Acidimicrobiales bacterium]
MQLLGVHHVAVNAADVDESVAFYVGLLGMTRREDRPDFGVAGAWLDAGDQQVHLIEAPVPDNRGQHFAVLVADLEASVAELRRHGVTVSDPSDQPQSRQAFLLDPSGNAVELHQRR